MEAFKPRPSLALFSPTYSSTSSSHLRISFPEILPLRKLDSVLVQLTKANMQLTNVLVAGAALLGAQLVSAQDDGIGLCSSLAGPGRYVTIQTYSYSNHDYP